MPSEMQERIARAIWNIRREYEDRCDMELEDMGAGHEVWAEALAAMKAMREPTAVMKNRVQAIGGDQALAYALASWPVMLLAEISIAEGGKDD